jgi:pimeloyl-ACP methyl ester carboxylesterase
MATAVLVHGAWSSPADWRWVAGYLQAQAVATVIPDLPSHRHRSADRSDDVQWVEAAIRAAAPPVAVAGWSYGGAVIWRPARHRPRRPPCIHRVDPRTREHSPQAKNPSIWMPSSPEQQRVIVNASEYSDVDHQLVVAGQRGACGSALPMNCCHSAAVRFLAAISHATRFHELSIMSQTITRPSALPEISLEPSSE